MTGSETNLLVLSDTIVQLIIDDLKILKLLQGFSEIGLDPSQYETKIYNAVFFMVGIKRNDLIEELKDWYFKQMESAYEIQISDEDQFRKIAGEIFTGLVSQKNLQNKSA